MCSSRRAFISASVSLAASVAALRAAQQGPPVPPFPPAPQQPPELPRNPKRDRLVLKANRDEITKDVTRMSELIDELQKQLKDHDMTNILSIDVIRKSEEIEKLARQVRDLVRG